MLKRSPADRNGTAMTRPTPETLAHRANPPTVAAAVNPALMANPLTAGFANPYAAGATATLTSAGVLPTNPGFGAAGRCYSVFSWPFGPWSRSITSC